MQRAAVDVLRQRQAHVLRVCRRIHRVAGITLVALFLVVATTGLLLGWKKHSGGWLLPDSRRGTSTDLADWLPLAELEARAGRHLHERVSPTMSRELERIDVRPDKGMVKFVYAEGYWGLQLDGVTGALLHVERRRSDFVEDLHDGSFLDAALDTKGEPIKVVFTTLMGVGLLTFCVTGFWLWLGPRRMRARGRSA
jgi:uncharacterized iron-regulated membrane protein